nr:MAG TPA: MuDR family transposase [Caudoviricetes sp.]
MKTQEILDLIKKNSHCINSDCSWYMNSNKIKQEQGDYNI